MTVATTVGPLEPAVRDRLADYRDANDLKSYNEALEHLLDQQRGSDRCSVTGS